MHGNLGDALSEHKGAVCGVVSENCQVGKELYSSMRTRSAKCVFGGKTQIPIFCMHTCFELGWKAGEVHEESKEQKIQVKLFD